MEKSILIVGVWLEGSDRTVKLERRSVWFRASATATVHISLSFIRFLYYCCDEDDGSDQIYIFSVSSFPVPVRSMFSREVANFNSVRGSWFRFDLLFLLDNTAVFSRSLDQNIVSADSSIVIKRTSNKQFCHTGVDLLTGVWA